MGSDPGLQLLPTLAPPPARGVFQRFHGILRKWLARRPRFHLHVTPTDASWIHQVERCFGIMTRKAIRRGCFRKVGELNRKINAFVEHYNGAL